VATSGDCRNLRDCEHAAVDSKGIKEHVGRLVRIQIASNAVLILAEHQHAALQPTEGSPAQRRRCCAVGVVCDDSIGVNCHRPMYPDSVGTDSGPNQDAVCA
jgi:hypothetical protein